MAPVNRVRQATIALEAGSVKTEAVLKQGNALAPPAAGKSCNDTDCRPNCPHAGPVLSRLMAFASQTIHAGVKQSRKQECDVDTDHPGQVPVSQVVDIHECLQQLNTRNRDD